MENNKNKQEGLSEQVHSEFETSAGNNFETVIRETQAKQDPENKEEPLNLPEQHEYEWDRAEEPAKMSMGETPNAEKTALLIVALGLLGLVSVVRVVKSMS